MFFQSSCIYHIYSSEPKKRETNWILRFIKNETKIFLALSNIFSSFQMELDGRVVRANILFFQYVVLRLVTQG